MNWTNLSTSAWQCTRRANDTADERSRVLLYASQVHVADEALRIDLVEILGARGASGEPAVLRSHLDAPDRFTVARRL